MGVRRNFCRRGPFFLLCAYPAFKKSFKCLGQYFFKKIITYYNFDYSHHPKPDLSRSWMVHFSSEPGILIPENPVFEWLLYFAVKVKKWQHRNKNWNGNKLKRENFSWPVNYNFIDKIFLSVKQWAPPDSETRRKFISSICIDVKNTDLGADDCRNERFSSAVFNA
jgi:hypothetical protein